MSAKRGLIIAALVVGLVSLGAGWYFFIKLPGDIHSRIDRYFVSFPAEVTAKYQVSEINVFQRVVRISNLSLFDSRRGYSFSVEDLTLSQGKNEGPVTVFDVVATKVRAETKDNELYSAQTVVLTGVLDPTNDSRNGPSITGPLVEYFAGLEFESLEILGSAFSDNNVLPLEGAFSSLVFENLKAKRIEKVLVSSLLLSLQDGDAVSLEISTGQARDIPLLIDFWSDPDPKLLLEEIGSIDFGGLSLGSLKFRNDEVELSLERFDLGQILEQRLESISVEGLSVRADDGEFGRLELDIGEATDIPLLIDFWSDPDPELLLEEIGSIEFGGLSLGFLKFTNDEVELSLDRFGLGQVLDQRLESISVERFSVRAKERGVGSFELGTGQATDIPLLIDFWSNPDPELFLEEIASISFGGGSLGFLNFKNDEVELSLERFGLGQVLEQRLESISMEGLSVRPEDGDNAELLGKSLEGVTVGLVKLVNVPINLQGMLAAGDDTNLFARHLSEGINMTVEDIQALVEGEKHSLKEVKLSARSQLLREEFYYVSTLSLDMMDLSIHPSVLPLLVLEQLGELEKTSVGKVSVGFSVSADHDERTVRCDMYVAPKNLGRLDLEIALGNVPESVFGASDQDAIMDLMSNFESLLEISPTKVLLRFVDDGLVTVGLEQFARQSNLEVSEALDLLANLIRAGSSTANDPGQMEMGEELIKFIESPKAINIVARPPEPITLNELVGYVMAEPNLLDDLLGLRLVTQ